MTPLMKMYTLGHSFIPAPIHAGGLRYHGMAPLVCALYDQKVIEAVAVHQNPTFEAALTFARAEGFLPAPEAAHAIRVVIDEALRCKASGEGRSSRSTSVATATSTSPPTSATWPASSRTSSTRPRK